MINLLPPEEKKELLAEERKRLILILGLVFLLSLFCLIIILVALKIYLLLQLDLQKNTLVLAKKQVEESETQDIQTNIQNFNQRLSRINDFYEKEANLREVFEKLIQTLPEGIYLNELSYSQASSQIILAGFSPSRGLLVQFKKNLEDSQDFQKVYFPPSSWIEPINVSFSGIKITIANGNSE